MDFRLDYLLFTFLAALGVLQLVAALNRLDGLLFIRPRGLAGAVGVLLVIGAFTWFFGTEPRNLPDTAGGLDGNQQTGLFAAGAGAALVLTLLLSSVLNFRRSRGSSETPGLDNLCHTTYIQALAHALGSWGRKWRQWMKKYSSG